MEALELKSLNLNVKKKINKIYLLLRLLKTKAGLKEDKGQRKNCSFPSLLVYRTAYLLPDTLLSNSQLSLTCLLNSHPVVRTGRQPLERKATEVYASYRAPTAIIQAFIQAHCTSAERPHSIWPTEKIQQPRLIASTYTAAGYIYIYTVSDSLKS